jgi:hypothetical protein
MSNIVSHIVAPSDAQGPWFEQSWICFTLKNFYVNLHFFGSMILERKIFKYVYHINCKSSTIPILMYQMHISTNEVSSVMLCLKKLEILKKCENYEKTIKYQSVMKLSQIRQRIELCMREIILLFQMNL